MTWTQSPPPPPAPVEGFTPGTITFPVSDLPADLLIRSIQIRMLESEAWYQIFTPEGPRYFSANDGREDTQLDTRLAFYIARRHLPAIDAGAFTYSRRLDHFDREYIGIFRLLPVHRIDVADGRGTRLYVSTQTGSIARHTDNRRQFEANVFGNLHKYSFIRHKPTRDAVLVTFTSLAFFASLGGVILFFVTRRPSRSV